MKVSQVSIAIIAVAVIGPAVIRVVVVAVIIIVVAGDPHCLTYIISLFFEKVLHFVNSTSPRIFFIEKDTKLNKVLNQLLFLLKCTSK